VQSLEIPHEDPRHRLTPAWKPLFAAGMSVPRVCVWS